MGREREARAVLGLIVPVLGTWWGPYMERSAHGNSPESEPSLWHRDTI